jgi:hypothetical protein
MHEHADMTHPRVGSSDPDAAARQMRRRLMWRRLIGATSGIDPSPFAIDPADMAARFPEHAATIERCLKGETTARRELDRLAAGMASRSLAAMQSKTKEQRLAEHWRILNATRHIGR